MTSANCVADCWGWGDRTLPSSRTAHTLMERAIEGLWRDRLVAQQHLVFIQQRILERSEMQGQSFAGMKPLQKRSGSFDNMDGTKNIRLWSLVVGIVGWIPSKPSCLHRSSSIWRLGMRDGGISAAS